MNPFGTRVFVALISNRPADHQKEDLGQLLNMAKAKSVTPQSKPAVAAKKNVKAKQAAVKAETKKSVPKKVGVAFASSPVNVFKRRSCCTRRVNIICRLRLAAARRSQATRMTHQSKQTGRPLQQQQR